jgi:hypothetical protein
VTPLWVRGWSHAGSVLAGTQVVTPPGVWVTPRPLLVSATQWGPPLTKGCIPNPADVGGLARKGVAQLRATGLGTPRGPET